MKAIVPRRLRASAIALAILSVAVAALLVFSSIRYERLDAQLHVDMPENRVWAAGQAERELIRFLDALTLAGATTDETARRVAGDQFEILWSRIGLYRQGELADAVASDPAIKKTVGDVGSALERVDQRVAELKAGDLASALAIRNELTPFLTQLRQMTVDELHSDTAGRRELRNVHDEVARNVFTFLALFTVSLVALLVAALRGERNTQRLLVAAEASHADAERSRTQLQQAIENISEGFALYGPDDRLVICNDQYRTFYATTSDLMTPGRPYTEIIKAGAERGQYVESQGRSAEWLAERLAQRHSIHAREQLLDSGRWVLVSNRQTSDGGLVCIRTDITKLKQREIELTTATQKLQDQTGEVRRLADEAERSNRLLLDAIESVDEGFSLYDADDRLVVCNATFREMYAPIRDHVVPGTRFSDILRAGMAAGIYPAENADAFVEERVGRRREERGRRFEEQLADGRWLRISNHATRDGGLVAVFTDITSLKERELELTAAKARLEAQAEEMRHLADQAEAARGVLLDAVESIGEGFSLYDGDDRLVLCNSRARQFFAGIEHLMYPGTKYEDIIRASFANNIVQGVEDPEAEIRHRISQRRQPGGLHSEEHLADGRWLWISTRPTADNGVVVVYADITELKRREIELTEAKGELERRADAMRRLADAAQAASEAKSQFLAMMSHEIRTPMNGVLGILNLLDDEGLDAEQHRLVVTGRRSAEALLTVLNDILDFSKVEAGKLELERSTFAPSDIAGSVVEFCEVEARAKGLQLELDIAADIPAYVMGDGGRIRQMLLNYVTNALKFTDRGRVTVRMLRTPGAVDSRMLRFLVEDTGIGIHAADIGDVFRDFTQLDRSMARRHGGTGLGLAITKRLAELMGGTVGFASEPGQGSRFWFDLPLPLGAATPTGPNITPITAAPLHTLTGGRPRVLLVEDNVTNQLVAKALLAKLGCDVELAVNGLEAIDLVSRRSFDLVLMDVSMPVMDGIEATRRLRRQGVTLPIVALTANAGTEERQRLLAAGMTDCLTKPAATPALRATLAAVLTAEHGRVHQMSESPLDPVALDTMREEIGDETLAVIVAAARDDLVRESERCRQALLAGDREGARASAHAVKGVAGSIGAKILQQTAAGIEDAAKNVAAALPASDALVDEIQSVLAALDALPLADAA